MLFAGFSQPFFTMFIWRVEAS